MSAAMSRCLRLGAGALLALIVACPSEAQTVEQFYRGRTLPLLVGFAPGGINDISARLVAKHLPRFIPGKPNIVVENQPGAGGLRTANHMYSIAAKDGSVLAGLDRATPQLAIQGDPGAQFDPLKFTWLGSLSSYADDAYLLLVNASHAAKSVADLKRPGLSLKLGAVSAGSTNLNFALLAKEALGLNVDLVKGYTGAAPIFLAMQSGEVDGQVIGLASIRAGQPDLWNNHKVRPLVQFGRVTRLATLPDVPTGRELAISPDARALVEFAELPFFMALPFVAPPGLPADRAATLKSGFMAMTGDAAFLEDAHKLSLDISPIDGDAIAKLLVQSAATPQPVIARYNAIVSPKN
jgi:tripartite-type tricarboxylate transporter receptor subunit TctC